MLAQKCLKSWITEHKHPKLHQGQFLLSKSFPRWKGNERFYYKTLKGNLFLIRVFLEDKWTSEIKAKVSLPMGCMSGEKDNTKWVFLALI